MIKKIKQQKRISFIINDLRIGGAERHTIDLANGLSRLGYACQIIALGTNNDLYAQIDDEIKVLSFERKSYLDFSVIRRVVRTLRDNQTTSIFAVNTFSMFYAFLANFLIKQPIQIMLIHHTTTLLTVRDKIKNFFYVLIMNQLDRIIYVSEMQKKYWKKKYALRLKKTTVIHNGINIARFNKEVCFNKKELKKELAIQDDETVITINACLRPEKGHEIFIEAIRNLICEGYKIKVLMIGDGPQKEVIVKTLKSQGIEDSVIMLGFVRDVVSFINISDIVVLSSIATETFSLSVLEAMAMEKPVILTDIGGAREQVVDGENGFIVPPKNPGELANRIKKIIDRDLFVQMGKSSRHRVEMYFSDDNMINRYATLIDDGIKND